jgi:hypothetical protein
MNHHKTRKFRPTWPLMRIAAALTLFMITCGFGHHPAAQTQSMNIGFTGAGGAPCMCCSGGTGCGTPTVTLMYSQDGTHWTTVIQNSPVTVMLPNFSVGFSVPTTGNYFISVTFTVICNGKTVIGQAVPTHFPVTGAWEGKKIYIPIYFSGC